MVDVRALERSWRRVQQLVERYADEWEGQDVVGDDPLRIFAGGVRAPRRVLVSTKAPAVIRWPISEWPAGLVVVAPTGLVTRAQASVVAKLASDRSAPIAFVGDADPMSLHAYACLRVHLGARVRFAGICDAVLDALGADDLQPERLNTLPFSALDRAHLRVVERLVKPERVLGPRVAAVLRKRKKIQIEALSRRGGVVSELFAAALTVAGR